MEKERVAEILERDAEPTMRDRMSTVERNGELSGVSLSHQERTGYLRLLLGDLVPPSPTRSKYQASQFPAAREPLIRRQARLHRSTEAIEMAKQ